jgi:ADP-dependent NAD(P)H-hydrate dehydratase / NAD(P)H-hydrate epimerase
VASATMDAMLVLSAAEMQACDRVTTERFGVPSIDLMRAASSAVATFVRDGFPHARRITVLCGRGNNGGDGMMTARLLVDAGLQVTTIMLGEPDTLKGDAATAWRELTNDELGTIHVVLYGEGLAHLNSALDADLIIDAVLGTGFKPPITGLPLDALAWALGSKAPVLSVDLPSGWPADSTDFSSSLPVFPSDAVVTFTAPKPAHVFGNLTRRWQQPVVVAPIGSPDEAIDSTLKLEWAGTAMSLVQAPRAVDGNKGKYGHVLVVGGTFGSAGGKTGAPAMAALGALRIGAGLVTAAVPMAALVVVSAIAPELMTWGLETSAAGAISNENVAREKMDSLLAGKTVLAVGPGLGQLPETARFLKELLAVTAVPTVIDADALNFLAKTPEMIASLARKRALVLTPHPGEMARLTGMTVAEIQANRVETARTFAERNGVTLVLKGARTLIAHPDGRLAVNTTGNPGMAKGGSGDLLTGFIAGMMAQFPGDLQRAVEAAVYLHGLAADLAVRAGDEHTLLATDCLIYLPRAFRTGVSHFCIDGKNRYGWIQGIPRDSDVSGEVWHE